MSYGKITSKQLEILDYMKNQILNKGYPPSVREICEAVGLKSTSSVHAHLATLEKNGYIHRDPTKPRAIEIVDDSFYNFRTEVVNVPLVGRVADRIIGLLEANELKRVDLIVNRIRMDMVKRGDMMSIEDVIEILAINLIGVVPDDENIVISTNTGEPLVGSDAPAGQAYMNICKRVLGQEVELLDLNENHSFWSKLVGLFKKN